MGVTRIACATTIADGVNRMPIDPSGPARAQVEPTAADQDRRPPAGGDLSEGDARAAGELAGRVALGGIENVDEVVRHPGALGERRLGGADVEPAVDLQRVGVDDLSAQSLGESERQRALSRCGRTDDGDDPGHEPR